MGNLLNLMLFIFFLFAVTNGLLVDDVYNDLDNTAALQTGVEESVSEEIGTIFDVSEGNEKAKPDLHEQFEKLRPLYPGLDESLAVDGDVVRPVSRPSQPVGLPADATSSSNATININSTLDTSPTNTTSFRCTCITGKEGGEQVPVELVNSTRLLNILTTEPNVTSRKSPANCVALLFYSQSCPYSALAAPHFNALPRAFPDIKMAAVDAMKFHSFNTQYGVVGCPTFMLFHNGRPVAKFNDTEYTLELFAKFLTKNTGIEPDNRLLYVMSADFGGPVSSIPTKETDYCLVFAWIFILACGVYFFSQSTWWKWIVESTQNTWREAEAQHEHAE